MAGIILMFSATEDISSSLFVSETSFNSNFFALLFLNESPVHGHILILHVHL